MANPPLPDEVVDLLKQPNPSVITSLRADGSPVSVATWYLWEDGQVLLNMDEGRKRLAYLRADPRVTLTVLAADDWYTHVSMQGRVSRISEDTEMTDIDRLARHYTGKQYPNRDRTRVSAWVDIERWHGWGAAENTDVTHH